jgi:hypothetical protein
VKRLALLGLVGLLGLCSGCFLFRSGGKASCPQNRVVELGLQEDVAKFTGCTRASGVTIRTGATIDVSPLHELEEISGDLVIGPTVGIDSVAFNGLLRVGGTIRVASNGSLHGLFLPRLEQVGRIEIDGNVVLTTISVPRLTAVQGAVVITDNHGLELVSATLLASIGGELVIADHPRLNLLELPRLARVSTVRIENNPKVPTEVVEGLRDKASTR